ncbi:MAG: DUF2461 domain-containing protein [Pseudomonadota bacterium]
MTDIPHFTKDTLAFLNALKANNTRDWFGAHKQDYEGYVKAPAAAFADQMTAALGDLTGHSYASKVYRIHRDIRFSKDKTPYKLNIHMSFSPGGTAPSWMFGLGIDKLSLGVGVWAYEGDDLEAFRQRILGAEGPKIAAVLSQLRADGSRLSDPALKRVPNGYDKAHPHADLLRYKGLAGWRDYPTSFATDPALVARVTNEFKRLRPLFDLLAP